MRFIGTKNCTKHGLFSGWDWISIFFSSPFITLNIHILKNPSFFPNFLGFFIFRTHSCPCCTLKAGQPLGFYKCHMVLGKNYTIVVNVKKYHTIVENVIQYTIYQYLVRSIGKMWDVLGLKNCVKHCHFSRWAWTSIFF